MFVPIILGSDKTTVSVATGNNKFYPLYISIGNVCNNVCRAHRHALVLLGFLAIPKSKCPIFHCLPKSAFEEIRKQLIRLHGDGFVHGDVRDANFMVRKGAGMVVQFMIIDFDWAGKIKVVCYPPYVNRKTGEAMEFHLDGFHRATPFIYWLHSHPGHGRPAF